MAGNAVGSPLPLRRYGPVTTDPFGERLQSCHRLDATSRRGKSMAGAIRGLSAPMEIDDGDVGRTTRAMSQGADLLGSTITSRDEGIVCPARKSGLRRSSDLHEWRNDFPTVSTTDPAKLNYE